MRIKRNELLSSISTVRTEGPMLPADLLAKVAELDSRQLKGLAAEDYHLVGEKINEAISRSWTRLLGSWVTFREARGRLSQEDPGTTTARNWMLVLFQELGYGRLMAAKSTEIEGKLYPISHFWNHLPIHLVGCNIDLDRRTAGVAGAAKTSPHSLVQEFLNRSEEHLWAFASNGLKMRILRDNKSFTRQAFVEFDLEAMFEGADYQGFTLLWLLCHQSRVESEKPEQCWLEQWSKESQRQGVRIMEGLRDGVQSAIEAFGEGFLSYPGNRALRERLSGGQLDKQDYYRQLLRLTYRMLFIFVAEDRDLLLLPLGDEDDQAAIARRAARDRFSLHYSTKRLRNLAERRMGTSHSDLWQGLRIVMDVLGETGCPHLALPALGSFLWSREAIKDLIECEISNRDLLEAVRALAFTVDGNALRPVDYRNLDSDELGSVYESLLELHPNIEEGSGHFELKTASGNERKSTGSYYTPTSLINCLLDSALDPVLEEAAKKPDPVKAILELKVCDPACGSGHFLIAAAHRMAKRLASIQTGTDEPSPDAVRTAIREIIGHCIYGVDINPMAVELCKINLWLEAIEPGKPLSFLDHRIQVGNSLLGATPALLKEGIPDAAFQPFGEDDKKFCVELKKQNQAEYSGKELLRLPLEETPPWERLGDFASAVLDLDMIPDDTIDGIHRKEEVYQKLVRSCEYEYGRLLADAWCASFVWHKVRDYARPYPITENLFRKIEKNPFSLAEAHKAEIRHLADQYQFFHWHQAFPDVFQLSGEIDPKTGWQGGFDCILGNPPWDKIQPEEEKFFSSIRPDIANASSAKTRKALIEKLPESDPTIHSLWVNHKRIIEGTCHSLRASKVMQFSVEGNLNSYRVFTELASLLLSSAGRAGLIVQTGLATDESGKELFDHLLSTGKLVRFLDFENREGFFPAVDSRFRFCLLTLQGKASKQTTAEFGWLLQQLDQINEQRRLVQINATDLLLFNPSSRTCPVFTSDRDFRVSKGIYERAQHIYLNETQRLGIIDFLGELFNMTRDSGHFQPAKERDTLPLYEAKFIHQFDHRYASFSLGSVSDLPSSAKANPHCLIISKSFVKAAIVREKAVKRSLNTNWMLGFRDIARATDERTSIIAVFPFSAVGNSINLVLGLSAEEAGLLMANANSFVFDFCARQKISGTHVNIWIFKQLPAIPFERYTQPCLWIENHCTFKDWLSSRVLELTYTAWDLKAFAEGCGYNGSPFRWDEERRFLLRCELDAAFFHLYGIKREDVDYIMETFPIVKRKDEAAHGEYRTKRVILEIYDAMQRAMETGEDHQTLLSPPPADPSVAHPEKALGE